MQLHGAYIFDGILKLNKQIASDGIRLIFEKLLTSLSYFEVESNLKVEKEYSQEYAVLINLLQRGLPTRLGIRALEILTDIYTEIEDTHHDYVLDYDFLPSVKKTDGFFGKVFLAFHIVDPRINRHNLKRDFEASWEKLGSQYEEMFLFDQLPDILNEDAILQLIESQRSFDSIAKDYLKQKKQNKQIHNNFVEQRIDFCIENVYHINNERKGIILEIDGVQHQSPTQMYLDTERDQIANFSGWANTIRISTKDFKNNSVESKLNYLKEYVNETYYFKNIKAAYECNFLKESSFKRIFEICLIPIAVARVQRTILEYIASGKLSKFKDSWRIAIIEQDVPCGYIAVEDLKVQIETLFGLLNKVTPLPLIHLKIYSTEEFINSEAHKFYSVFNIDSWNPKERFDLVIDISVLQRNGLNTGTKTANPNFATIRSSYHLHEDRIVKSSAFIEYKEFANKRAGSDEIEVNNTDNHNEGWEIDQETENNLKYFLQSIFRKKSFRSGQLPIIIKAISGHSVIGLLATGGGKSLTYQLSTLLQPGITMAVDPINSLMKDQVKGLNENYIDTCSYINSLLSGEEKRHELYKLKEGQSQFVFITPERLQMKDFRETLAEMSENGNYFSFCVIDEAHCVSEWGHDFRTAYLKLGENAINFCKTKSGKKITLFGLTATASFDVLSDVQRELSGSNSENRLEDDAIVRFESTDRAELQYHVESIVLPETEFKNIWDLQKQLGNLKQERMLKIVLDVPRHIQSYIDDASSCFSDPKGDVALHKKISIENYSVDGFYKSLKNAALVFCPHTKGYFGVTDKFKVDKNGDSVSERHGFLDIISSKYPGLKTGFFIGSGSDDERIKKDIERLSIQSQDDFISSKINFLVATKAFGMGIDKESIRYTVHVSYPGSIESYVQEAGRAGRDGKIALSYILFNDQQVKVDGKECELDKDNNFYFHNNSFKGESKELAILDELLQEIYFPNRTFELESLINQTLEVDLKIAYWEKGGANRLYVNVGFKQSLGYLDLNTSTVNMDFTVDEALSIKVFEVLKRYIANQHPNQPLYVWIQQGDKQAGIQHLLNKIQIGDSFSLTIGFRNNGLERIRTITEFLKKVVYDKFTEENVKHLKESAQSFQAFSELIEQFYLQHTGRNIELEKHCIGRDNQRGIAHGTTFGKFEAYYNGYRDKTDSEKAIFRLSTLGIIDDYTVDFAANTFTINGKKKKDEQYEENLKVFLLKYYSVGATNTRLKSLKLIKGDTAIEKCLTLLVHFVYEEIKKKRELAIMDMKDACLICLKQGNIAFKEYIDLYFNSKYARKGYSYFVGTKEIQASLTDQTDEGKKPEDINLVWFFIDVVENDPKAGFIDNVKHLRGACVRLLRSQPDNYIFLLLNAFAIYQTSFTIERFLINAEDLLQNAFVQMDREHLSDEAMQQIFDKFVKLTILKNPNLSKWMKKFDLVFDFDRIVISRLLPSIKASNALLTHLNSILLN